MLEKSPFTSTHLKLFLFSSSLGTRVLCKHFQKLLRSWQKHIYCVVLYFILFCIRVHHQTSDSTATFSFFRKDGTVDGLKFHQRNLFCRMFSELINIASKVKSDRIFCLTHHTKMSTFQAMLKKWQVVLNL